MAGWQNTTGALADWLARHHTTGRLVATGCRQPGTAHPHQVATGRLIHSAGSAGQISSAGRLGAGASAGQLQRLALPISTAQPGNW